MRRIFFALLAAVCASAPLQADLDRTKKPAAGPAPEASFPDYKETTLPNGLKIFVIEDDRKPTITLRLLLRSGAVFDGSKTGLASFVATLLNRGTEHRDAAAFAKEIDFLGATLEASAAPDSLAVTTSGLTIYTDKLLDLFTDAVLHPAFPPDQVARVQRQMLSQLAAEKQQPAALAAKLTAKVLYGTHPYGAHQTPETVKAITRDDLVAFHQAHFLPNNATLAVVGDVKSADLIAKLEKALGGWAKGVTPKLDAPPIVPLQGVTVHLLDRPASVQSNFLVLQDAPARNNPDVPELNVLNAALGGGFSGRLFQNLREKHGWTYGAYSVFDMRKLGGGFSAKAETRNEVTGQAIEETRKEINRIRTEPVPDAELELQRQYNVGNYLLSLENPTLTAQRVQDIDLYGLPADFYKHYAARMAATTAQEIEDLAKKYLHPDAAAIVVVGEAKDVKPQLEKFGKVLVYDTDLNPAKDDK
jgi:predicted Zn-dependent peptidase